MDRLQKSSESEVQWPGKQEEAWRQLKFDLDVVVCKKSCFFHSKFEHFACCVYFQ